MNATGMRLAVRNLSKTFPGQVALDHAELEIEPGEVHALLGQNGSGKSTLIKVLAGFHQPDPGAQAQMNGVPLTLGSAAAADNAGIRFIHQDLGLVPTLDVVDNLALGQSYRARWWLSDRREATAATELLAELGVRLDVRSPVARLSAAERTIVAVARALRGGLAASGLLVLDEPTASLPSSEIERLFELIRAVKARGSSVLYVTHRMGEIFQVADRVTVLRDGRRVASEAVGGVTQTSLIEQIVGRPLEEFYPEPPPPDQEVVLSVTGLTTDRLQDLSLDLHRGEILGIAGITGSGREDVAPALFGAIPWRAGQLIVDGTAVEVLDPASAIDSGIAYLPHDRKRESAIPSFSVRENLTLPRLRPQRGWLSARRERADADDWLARLDVRPSGSERIFSTLSGGNQQKVVIARWLRCGAKVLVLDEPTQGVDVGAKSIIYQTLSDAAREGAAVVVVSTDVEELARLCDRVLVLRDGSVAAELQGTGLTVDRLSQQALATGVPA